MPRMFDVLKGKGENPKPEKNKPGNNTSESKPDTTVPFPRQIRSTPNDKPKDNSNDTLKISKKMIDEVKKKGVDNPEIAKEKYAQALAFVEVLLEKVNKAESLDSYLEEIHKIVDVLTNQLILGDSLLEIVAKEYETTNYLPKHIVNVCILSLTVGLQMKLNKSKLHTLGIAAILKDVGMLTVREITKQPRALSREEHEEVKKHTSISAEFASKIGDAYNTIKEIIEQHHERMNGRGYPLGLKTNEINDYAKIIGLADTYEAMTHNRAFREAKMPHQVIREIIDSLKPLFEPEIIKALIDKISIYPIGSFVKLNNGYIAKVVSSNTDSPLRPMVLVLLDSYGNHVSEPKMLDLSKEDSFYIREPVVLKDSEI